MKKIVCAIYHDCNREARSLEILECCSKMGQVHYVSYAAPKNMDDVTCYLVNKKNPLALLNFLDLTKKVIRKVKPDIVFLHDNDCAALIPFIRKFDPKIKLVYDSSELYIPMPNDKHTKDKTESSLLYLKQRLTAFRPKCEKKYLREADVVLAANIERASIMKDYFKLKELPIVFDNIHRIDDEYDGAACTKKLDRYFDSEAFNILFAGGIGAERQTYDYIRAVNAVKDIKCNLVIAGSASETARNQYEELIKALNMDNVGYVGLLTRAELRYCMQKSQASVVVFDKKSYNTIYCASGKCYESLFEGVPILASENPPLKRLCEDHHIGVSDDDFARGIESMVCDYIRIKENVNYYVNSLRYESRVSALHNAIERKLFE